MADVRTVLNNPFEPGSGAVPPIWVGRDDELADITSRLVPRRRAGLFERGRTYLGDPGLGKSVLVNRIAEERARAGDLVAGPLRMALGRDPLAALADVLAPLVPAGERVAGKVTSALERVREVGLLGARVGMTAADEDRYASLSDLVEGLAVLASETDRLLVVRVDEVQNLSGAGLSQLLTILGDALEMQLPATDVTGNRVMEYAPVVVLLSGLPAFPERAAAAGATFSRRFATTYLDPFTDDEVRAALAFAFADGYEVLTDDGPALVHLEVAAREALVEVCLGDPFLFQLAGAAAWDASTGAVLTAADVRTGWDRVRREVEAHVRQRTAGLTELQLSVLTAAARTGGEQADGTTLAQAVGRRSSSDIGSTLQALVTKRLLALGPDGYRVVSRAVARNLAGG